MIELEWAGWIAMIMLLYYSSYPGKVNKLECKVKKLERKQGGKSKMSKIINDLVGKNCKIESDNLSYDIENDTCMILEADDEWIKISYIDSKKVTITKILRIESIETVELINE